MPNEKQNKKVVILQHRLLHYRVDFFQRLYKLCTDNGIELHLVHGQPSPSEKARNDTGELDWSTPVRNRFLSIGGTDLIWQSLPGDIHTMDLIVVMQENRIISNYPLLIKNRFSDQRVAYWGHGANFQSRSPNGLRERWKKFWINSVDWWFSYTDITTELLVHGGYSRDNISTLNNAVDTDEFRNQWESVSDKELSRLREQMNIGANDRVGIFCGSLYPDKKISLLLHSADLIRARIPNFHLLVVGAGPSSSEVLEYAASRPWIHSLGVRKGREKAAYFRLANIMFNPGLLGLHILDSFAIGLPLISTTNALHSPEIAYIENGKNSVLVNSDNPEDYAAAAIKLFEDESYYDSLSARALQDSQLYTLDNMVGNFFHGIQRALVR